MPKSAFRNFLRTNTSFEEIFNGEYDLDLIDPPKTVLDLGANEGAFTAWALERWPGCTVEAFEPVPENAELFRHNHDQNPKVHFHQYAVTLQPKALMHPGLRNSGGCSIYDLGEQKPESFEVEGFNPKLINCAEFVKIDTEGCELEILSNLDLSMTRAIVCEWHRDEDADKIVALLAHHGFNLVFADRWWTDRGIFKFTKPGMIHNRVKTVQLSGSHSARTEIGQRESGMDIFIPDSMNFSGNTADGKLISLQAGHLRNPHYRPELAGKKLFIGVPVYSSAATLFVQCLMALQAQKPLPIEVHFGMGDGIARTRNQLSAAFLKSDCTHLLFIDCDLIFSADDIVKLILADQPIIGGFYPKKQQGPLEWVINTLPNMPAVRPDKLQPVKYVGTGFICIRRDVFQKMKTAYPELAYREDYGLREMAWDFWSMGSYRNANGEAVVSTRKLLNFLEKEDVSSNSETIQVLASLLKRLPNDDEGRYLSEDWYFCQRWLDMGGENLMHTKVMIRHFGSVIYPLDTQMAEVSNPLKQPPPKSPGNSDAAISSNNPDANVFGDRSQKPDFSIVSDRKIVPTK